MKTDAFEIERLRSQYDLRGHRSQKCRRIPREDMALWGFVAMALIVPAIAAAMFIIL